MRIKQLYSSFGIGFTEAMTRKYDFLPYTDPLKPVFIFGCYNYRQIGIAINAAMQSPLVVICWAGSDSSMLLKLSKNEDYSLNERYFWIERLKKTQNIKHIAISHWIEEDLKELQLEYRSLPITPHDYSNIRPEPLGDAVYMYRPDVPEYNGGIYQEIKSKLPYRFIETNAHTFDRDKLMDAYKQSFIGLRFTKHDGLSNTVCEMGMMGRMVIHNGDTPNSIHYNGDADKIIATINDAYKYNFDVHEIGTRVKSYLDIGTDFLDTDWYE